MTPSPEHVRRVKQWLHDNGWAAEIERAVPDYHYFGLTVEKLVQFRADIEAEARKDERERIELDRSEFRGGRGLMPATIDNSINWSFTFQWLYASATLFALCILAWILWQIWRETR